MSEEREVIDTRSEIEESFFKNLAKKPPKNVRVPERDEIVTVAQNFNTEEVLSDLFETRDSLIDMVTNDSDISSPLVENINKLGACIKRMGGEAEDFDPYLHITGLQSPNMVKNAHRVLENTKEAYTLGKITDTKVDDNGKTIVIAFSGIKDDVAYKAVGTVIAPKVWVGNEAIEYIYTPGEGRLSVKALNEDGKWIDKSANYKISWELSEGQMNAPENKEEVRVEAQNNVEEEISDEFPIEDKT